jgi:hypothetical protein
MTMSDYSTFLFTTPSAIQGAGSVLDLAGQLAAYNESINEAAADLRALRADHAAVIADARAALREFAVPST